MEYIHVDEIELKKTEYYIRQLMSAAMFRDIKVDYDRMLQMLVVRASKDMVGHAVSRDCVKYPENWKEAIRERFAPIWFKKRWPVKYTKFDAFAVYEDFLQKNPQYQDLQEEYITYAFFEEPQKIGY